MTHPMPEPVAPRPSCAMLAPCPIPTSASGRCAAGRTVVVLGGGGHAKVLISVIRKLPWTIAGYVDPRDVGPVLGVPHAGGDDVLPALLARHPGCAAAMGVGKVDATDAPCPDPGRRRGAGVRIPHLRLSRRRGQRRGGAGGRHGRLRRGRRQRGCRSPGPPASSTPTPPWSTTAASARTSTSAPARP